MQTQPLAIIEVLDEPLAPAFVQQRREQRQQRRSLLADFYANLYDAEIGETDKQRWNMEWLRQRDLWLAQQTSEHTRLAYARALQEWTAYLYEVHAIQYPWMVDTSQALAWLDHMGKQGSVLAPLPRPLAPATINQRLAAVSSYYTHMESCTKLLDGNTISLFISADGHPRRNPFLSAALKRPGVNPYAGSRPVPTEAMQWILRTLGDKRDKTIADRRDYALLLLFYRTGYRAGTTLSMQWGAIDEAPDGAGATFDWRGKGGKQKRKTLPPRVYHAIVAYLKADGRYAPGHAHHIADDDYIWRPVRLHGVANFGVETLDANRPITPSTATEILRRHLTRYYKRTLKQRGYTPRAAAAEAAHIAGKYHLHSLRHTFAGELAQASQDNLLLVQELLDHESADTTRIYIGAIKAPVDKATALLEQQFGI